MPGALGGRLRVWHGEVSERWIAGVGILLAALGNLDALINWAGLSDRFGVGQFFARIDWRVWIVLWLLFTLVTVLEALFHAASAREAAAKQLEEKQHNQQLSDKMSDHHEWGVHELLNKPPTTPEEIEAWRKKEKGWVESTLREMRSHNCSKQEKRHVQTLGLFPQYQLHPDPQVSLLLSMTAIRLQRIADIASKYGE